MGRGPRVAFAAVMCVLAVVTVAFLTKQREVIQSTPSAYTGLTVPLPLAAGSEACLDEIVFDTRSGIARFGAATGPGNAAPELEVTARGYTDTAFRNTYRSVTRVPGGWKGTRQLDVPLKPPAKDSFGYFCVRNLGDVPIDLVGSLDGRAYSRPTVSIDGHTTPIELQFRLLQPGKHSLISRIGQTTAHASTLAPFGPWWWWVLALALAVGAPIAVFKAVRAALDGDAELGLDRELARLPWPPPILRRPYGALARVPGWAIVAAGAVFALLWFTYWGLDTHVFQNDEDQYVYLSRWLQTDFPASLFDFAAYGRGLQRLEVWLLAIPAWLFDSPWSLRLGRILNATAFISTAIPIYLLGRGLRLSPRWAALPALVSVMVPWAVVTTGFLTENVAYPACLWAAWAIWRTAVAGSPRRDVLALVLLVVAGAARSGLLLLVPVLPIVVAGTGLRCTTGSFATRLRIVAREHWVLSGAVAFGVLVLVADGLGIAGADGIGQRLAGGYQTVLGFDLWAMIEKQAGYLSKVIVGTGFFPAAIGLPWVAIRIARSRERETFGFALLAVVVAAALLYSLNAAGPDERYVLYLAPFVLLPATLALARDEISPLGVGITSVLLGVLLWRVPWSADQGPFGFFVTPVEMYYTHSIGMRLDQDLPGGLGAALDTAALLLAAAGVALALVLARGRERLLTRRRAIVLVAAVVLLVPLQAQYTFSKYVNGAGSKAAPTIRTRAFADTNVPSGKTVGEFAEGVGQLPGFFAVWQEVQFYNQRIDKVYALGDNVNPVPPGDGLVQGIGFDADTGRITSPEPLPDYLAIPTQVGKVRVRGAMVASLSYIPVALIKVDKPATLDWSAEGFDPVGNVAAGAEGKTRFYGTGRKPGSYCGSYALLAPPDKAMAWRIDVAGGPPRSGSIAAGKLETVQVALPDLVKDSHVDVRISGDGIRVAGIGVGPGC